MRLEWFHQIDADMIAPSLSDSLPLPFSGDLAGECERDEDAVQEAIGSKAGALVAGAAELPREMGGRCALAPVVDCRATGVMVMVG